MSSLLVWLAVVTLLGWLHFPLCFRVGRDLRDRGLGLSKIAGVFLPTYVGWLLCHTSLPHTRTLIVVIIVAVALLSALIARRDLPALREFFRRHWRAVLTLELVFWLGALASAWVRAQIPAIVADFNLWGAEKWSDFTLLSALTRQTHFPPADPWLAGYPTNYYYFGHLVWATLAKLTGSAPEVAYNLSLATIVALALTVCVSLGYHVFRSLALGLLLAWLVVIGGNLKPAAQIHTHWPEARAFAHWYFAGQPPETATPRLSPVGIGGEDAGMPPLGELRGMFWTASREMDYTPAGVVYPPEPEINEFPSFSFILGDLHPHFSAHPLFLAFLLILAALWRANRRHTFSGQEVLLDRMPLWLTLALVAGVLYMTNSWDCFVALFLAAFVLPFARGFRAWPPAARVVLGLLILGMGYVVSTRLFALPYDLFFVPPKKFGLLVHSMWPPRFELSPLGWVPAALRSTTTQWLLYFGLFAVPYFAWMLCEAGARTPRVAIDRRTAWLSVALALGMVAFCQSRNAFVGMGVFVLLLSAPVAWQRRRRERLELVAVSAWVALLVSFLCEFFYYDDGFSGANERINTVFKVYYCVWPVAALAAVGALSALWGSRVRRPPDRRSASLRARRVAATGAAIALVAVSGLYPLFAWTIRLAEYDEMFQGVATKPTLDGLAYLEATPGTADDYRAGLWLRENASPYALVAEASDWGYSQAGRFAAIGGVISFLGWSQHETLWREGFERVPVAERKEILDELFNTPSLVEAITLIMENGIDYVAVGTLERERYDATGLAKFRYLGQPVFQSGRTALYHASRAIFEAWDAVERDVEEWVKERERLGRIDEPEPTRPDSRIEPKGIEDREEKPAAREEEQAPDGGGEEAP